MKKVRDMTTSEEVEKDLDRCLRELRATDRGNTIACSSLEYRIGRLRERKAVLA